MYPPQNVIHLAYVVFFFRLAPWWWSIGRHGAKTLDGRVRQVILWHLCPSLNSRILAHGEEINKAVNWKDKVTIVTLSFLAYFNRA